MIFTDMGAPTPASPPEQGEAKEGRMAVLDTETDYFSWLTVTVIGVIFVCFNGTIVNFVVKLWIYKNNRKKKHQRSVLKELELLKTDRHLSVTQSETGGSSTIFSIGTLSKRRPLPRMP